MSERKSTKFVELSMASLLGAITSYLITILLVPWKGILDFLLRISVFVGLFLFFALYLFSASLIPERIQLFFQAKKKKKMEPEIQEKVEVEKSRELQEFIKTTIESIKKGTPQPYYLATNIDFEIAVVTTKEAKGGIQVIGCGRFWEVR